MAGTRVSLDSVVIGFQRGESAEEIRRNFPTLSLEQVYGVITYYLAHRQDVEAYLERQRKIYEQLRAESLQDPSPAVQRLRKLKEQRAAQ